MYLCYVYIYYYFTKHYHYTRKNKTIIISKSKHFILPIKTIPHISSFATTRRLSFHRKKLYPRSGISGPKPDTRDKKIPGLPNLVFYHPFFRPFAFPPTYFFTFSGSSSSRSTKLCMYFGCVVIDGGAWQYGAQN